MEEDELGEGKQIGRAWIRDGYAYNKFQFGTGTETVLEMSWGRSIKSRLDIVHHGLIHYYHWHQQNLLVHFRKNLKEKERS